MPDPKFNDTLVTRFVNDLMMDGKKNIAYQIFYDAMDILAEKNKDNEKTPLEIWKFHQRQASPYTQKNG